MPYVIAFPRFCLVVPPKCRLMSCDFADGIMAVYLTPTLILGTIASSMAFGLWNLYAGTVIMPLTCPNILDPCFQYDSIEGLQRIPKP